MPNATLVKRILAAPPSRYLLDERFDGNQISTRLWTVTDTGARLSVSGGNLVSSGGSASWGDPRLVSVRTFARLAGLTYQARLSRTNTTQSGPMLGFANAGTGAVGVHKGVLYTSTTNVIGVIVGSGGVNTLATYAITTFYLYRIVLKAIGYLAYVSADNGATWVLAWEDSTQTDATLYAIINNYSAAFSGDYVRVYRGSVKPADLSTTPAAPTPATGAELLSNGSFTDWTADNPDNWTLSGAEDANNYVTQNPAGQAQIVADSFWGIKQYNTTAGTWYSTTFDVKALVSNVVRIDEANVSIFTSTDVADGQTFTWRGAGGGMFGVFRGAAGASNWTVDNVSLKALTLSSLMKPVGTTDSKYGIYDFAVTVGANRQAGGMCCLDSESTPANYLHAYYDRNLGKVFLLKVVGGTTTELTSTTVTYGAGNIVRVIVTPGTSGLSNAQVALYLGAAASISQRGTTQTVDLSSGFGNLVDIFDTSGAATVAVTVQSGIGV